MEQVFIPEIFEGFFESIQGKIALYNSYLNEIIKSKDEIDLKDIDKDFLVMLKSAVNTEKTDDLLNILDGFNSNSPDYHRTFSQDVFIYSELKDFYTYIVNITEHKDFDSSAGSRSQRMNSTLYDAIVEDSNSLFHGSYSNKQVSKWKNLQFWEELSLLFPNQDSRFDVVEDFLFSQADDFDKEHVSKGIEIFTRNISDEGINLSNQSGKLLSEKGISNYLKFLYKIEESVIEGIVSHDQMQTLVLPYINAINKVNEDGEYKYSNRNIRFTDSLVRKYSVSEINHN